LIFERHGEHDVAQRQGEELVLLGRSTVVEGRATSVMARNSFSGVLR
jgi:hypothetical protein